ncbi:DinB family protein [Formosa maritima]|uniref:DinB family protein n=1 Tax=Formosa maritima TaxID=2592046 RepID=A0A5D0GMK0_9FLAO|nr:DinB family protein [Formosa maritima]TYA58927.1 DinB family protein [Formosa maritima]
MKAFQILESEYADYYANYIKKAGNQDIISGLESSLNNTMSFFKSIPEEKLEFRYEIGKWTIKDIIQHLIDAERVFAYRALRFARKDNTPLPGFEENDYTIAANANKRSREELLKEYQAVRESTIMLFKNFDEDTLKLVGIASNSNMSVRAIGFVIIGHETHHCDVIKSRYL